MIDQNLLTYLESLLTENRKQRFIEILSRRTYHITVALEDVYQLHNTSAVMRSCEVFGLQQLHVVEERFGKRIEKEIALGAEKWVDIARHTNRNSCLQVLKEKGYQIIATSPHEGSTLLDDFDITTPSAIFFGTEKEGLHNDVLTRADGCIKIPMHGFTESLNISVAAAIIIQNLTSRLRNSTVNWKLTENQILEKRLDWARKSIKDIERIEARFYEAR